MRFSGTLTTLATLGLVASACGSNFSPSDCKATRTCAGSEAARGSDAGAPASDASASESGAGQGSELADGQGGAAPTLAGAGGADEPGAEGGATQADAEAALGGAAGDRSAMPSACGDTPVHGCQPDPSGVLFVNAASAEGGDGSQSAPFNTISAALGAASAGDLKRIAICNATYPEQVALGPEQAGISLQGGFSCDDWRYLPGTHPEVAPAKEGYALSLNQAKSVSVADIDFTALSGSAASASSVAAFVNDSLDVRLTRCQLRAGAGNAGADGKLTKLVAGKGWPTAAELAGNEGLGWAAASAADYVGAPGKSVQCPDGSTSAGGRGGSDPATEPGEPGKPLKLGGAGGLTNKYCDVQSSITCVCVPVPDNAGRSGTDGQDGGGAFPGGVLTLGGFVPNGGEAGALGSAGGGGGGGNGAWQSATYGYQQGWYGGGGGGVGGCGGNGGAGGQGGGASIALLARSSELSLTACVLSTQDAGAGGKGSAGQPGQVGGIGGAPLDGDNSQPCSGGSGGQGGKGGAGGGGAGGLSVGLAWAGRAPLIEDSNVFELGQPGLGGAGAAADNAGAAGMAKNVLQLAAQ